MAVQETHDLVSTGTFYTQVNTWLIALLAVFGAIVSFFVRKWIKHVEENHKNALIAIDANRHERERGQISILEQISNKTRDRQRENAELRRLVSQGREEMQTEQAEILSDLSKICERLSSIEQWTHAHDKIDDERQANTTERLIIIDAVVNASKNEILNAREKYLERLYARAMDRKSRMEAREQEKATRDKETHTQTRERHRIEDQGRDRP